MPANTIERGAPSPSRCRRIRASAARITTLGRSRSSRTVCSGSTRRSPSSSRSCGSRRTIRRRTCASGLRCSALLTATERQRLGRYLADAQDPADMIAASPALDVSPLSGLTPDQRADVARRTRTALARACLNLGVMHAQKQRFTRAADFFEQAVAVDADFPQAQDSLCVAYFNSQQHARAVRPLARALDADRASTLVRRMLAIAYLNTEAYGQSAALLADDPQRDADSSLQYAY